MLNMRRPALATQYAPCCAVGSSDAVEPMWIMRPPLVALFHLFAYKLCTVQRASEVDCQHLVPVIDVAFEQATEDDDTGVVYEDVYLLEFCKDNLD